MLKPTMRTLNFPDESYHDAGRAGWYDTDTLVRFERFKKQRARALRAAHRRHNRRIGIALKESRVY